MNPIKTNEELSTQISPVLSPITIRSKQMTPLITFDWGLSSTRSLLLVCKLSSPVIDTLFDFARRLLLDSSEKCSHIIWHIYVEETLSQHPHCLRLKDDVKARASMTASKLLIWPTSEESMSTCKNRPDIDLIVSLGGDGTVLHSAWLFQGGQVPPILPVYVHGSLGFLTVFDLETCNSFIHSVACSPCNRIESSTLFLNTRMRLRCTIVRSLYCHKSISTHEKLIPRFELEIPRFDRDAPVHTDHRSLLDDDDDDQLSDTFVSTESFHVLNELVIDRGPSPFMTILELYGDDRHLTTVQADGLVIATPTGSTAYSMSAGGSIVDPSVPAILITPICAHTLSFRPLHLRDNIEIKVLVPLDARHTAWASFDGRHRVELQRGDYIIISVSNYPVPTLCSKDQTLEWFESLQKCLQWNERRRQE